MVLLLRYRNFNATFINDLNFTVYFYLMNCIKEMLTSRRGELAAFFKDGAQTRVLQFALINEQME